MSRRVVEYRNDAKTKLSDRGFMAMKSYRAQHGLPSDSLTIARIVDLFLLGAIGTLPAPLVEVSDESGQLRTIAD